MSAAVVTERDSAQSRGFGFVEMSSDTEAEGAIAKLNQQEVETLKELLEKIRS